MTRADIWANSVNILGYSTTEVQSGQAGISLLAAWKHNVCMGSMSLFNARLRSTRVLVWISSVIRGPPTLPIVVV